MASLDEYWNSLTDSLNCNESKSAKEFEIIKYLYSLPDRHYHNLSHLESLFHILESFEMKFHNKNAVGFAIFYHDAVYDVMSKENEKKSAGLAVKFIEPLDVELSRKVLSLIMATKTHISASNDQDELYFIDADFSILGAPAEIYIQAANNVRKEYWSLENDDFNEGRGKFLKETLARDNIFVTKEFRDLYENQARENMENELKKI
ncbi:MAG: hypothetical protein ABUK01_07215 [Leptospirales bacterium]